MKTVRKVYRRRLLLIALAAAMGLALTGSNLVAYPAGDVQAGSQPEPLYVWTTPEGEAAYGAAYDAMLELWPVPYESLTVPSRFGTTHVIASGPADAPPLVLLHAVNNSATEWFLNVGELSREHRTYALDGIGDAGKSVPTRLPQSGADYAAWLTDVFDGLGLDRPDVAGHSYGGWIALNLALHAPERVNRLVLLSPSKGIAPFHRTMELALQLMASVELPISLGSRGILQGQAAKGYVANDTFVELMDMKIKYHRGKLIMPTVLTDDELRQIQVPTLLVIGEQEPLYDPNAAVERAVRLMRHIQTELIPSAGHLLPMEQPESVNRCILDYLEQ